MPLPGSQNPVLSQNMAQRFENAGLGSFTPYLDPWDTIARAQQYKNLERDINRQDMLANAEDQFMEAVRTDPQKGYEKFIAANPLAVMSPMVRAYAVNQNQRRQQAPEDRIAASAAEMGSRAYGTFRKSRDAGKSDLEAFAEAVTVREAEERENKPTRMTDDRANLTGEPAEKLASIMADIYETPEPTDDEKKEFLPKDKQPTEADWTRAYYQATDKKRRDAVNRLKTFQATYGEMFKVPGTGGIGAPQTSMVPAAQQTAPAWPEEVPTTFGPQKTETVAEEAVVTPQGATEEVSVATQQPKVDEAPSRYQGFKGKSRDELLPPTGPEKFIQEMTPFFSAVGDIVSAPIDTVSDVFWAPKGTKLATLFSAPPNQEQSNKRWDMGKKSVQDFLVDVEGSKEGALELARSIVAGSRLPADEFYKDGEYPKDASLPADTRIDATLAALDGLRKRNKLPSGPAFRDLNGAVTWDKVIRAAAQDLLEENGELVVERTAESAPASKKPNITAIREKK